jgi:transglutaminase-like putative cysteine protease
MSGSARWLQILGLGALAAGLAGLDFSAPLSWLSAGLLVLAGLKLAEARSLPERRLVSLLTLIGGGVQGAQQGELLPSLLQLLATALGLAGLLALEVGSGLSWRAVLRRSLAVLLAALPVALVLFLLVPRIEPIWQTPNLRGAGASAVTGLNSELDPGSISNLADNTGPAARVSFSSGTLPEPAERYWRVIVHEQFDGQRWKQRELPSHRLATPTGAASDPESKASSQVWLVEPSPVNALPWDGSGRANPNQLRVNRNGELQPLQASRERQAYLVRATGSPQPWQQRQPSPADLELPAGSNPQLEALGASWRDLATPEQRLAAAKQWFTQQDFRYSRSPGAQRGLDVFLFKRREGFCGHYASAFTALMRAAGVPARVVSGYLGGTWVRPLSGAPYLDLRHSNAHAWSEVWLPGQGWQRIDPSAWATAPASQGEGSKAGGSTNPIGAWLQWLQWQWWGLDLAWSRWWLGFDQAGQEALLQRLFGDQRQWLGALVLGAVAGLVALALAWLQWLQQPDCRDQISRELQAVVKHLKRSGVAVEPGESFEQLCNRASRLLPASASNLQELARCHNLLRYAALGKQERLQHWAAWRTALRTINKATKSTL